MGVCEACNLPSPLTGEGREDGGVRTAGVWIRRFRSIHHHVVYEITKGWWLRRGQRESWVTTSNRSAFEACDDPLDEGMMRQSVRGMNAKARCTGALVHGRHGARRWAAR